ncbi:MAG: flagellar assembly protein FliH [Peptococcaceae bacterium]|nr:flagellar assembly protein FliH [Peptococcaceae bacterium]
MKLFTKSSILKSTTVEITSPRILESPDLEKEYKKFAKRQGVPLEFPVLSTPGEAQLAEESAEIQTVSPLDRMKEESNTILLQARQQAEQILVDARNKAEEIIRTAQEDSMALRKSVEEEVQQVIIPLAQAQGYEKGVKEAVEEAERLRKQSKAYLEMAQNILMDELHKADKELVRLCLVISEKILHSVLEFEPERLVSMIRNLTLLPREKEGIKIHLSGRDWEWYKMLPLEDKPPYPVIVDETLKPGDAFLECAEGVFDARINSQLEKIEQHLFEELDHGRLDGFSKKD